MQKIDVLCGMSVGGRISIVSDRFIATARHVKGQQPECSVRKLASLVRFFMNSRFPFPRTARLFVFSGVSSTGLLLILASCAVVIQILNIGAGTLLPAVPLIGLGVWFYSVLFVALFLLYARTIIAPWHGAEHMAIAAYWRNGSTNLDALAKESPVNDKCGGRIFVFAIVAFGISMALMPVIGIPQWATSLIMLEVGLWLDKLVGLDHIPGVAHISRLLQKHITTRVPGEVELRTAQAAMLALLAEHQKRLA